jgi:hypothetical protein
VVRSAWRERWPGGVRAELYYISVGWTLRPIEVVANEFFRSQKPWIPSEEAQQPALPEKSYWTDDEWIFLLAR